MSQANGFSLNWTSSINNFALPQDGGDYGHDHLFKSHILNLVNNLINSASWEVLSCSYYDQSSATYRLTASNKWNSINNIKFPESMVSGGTVDYQKISDDLGVYQPSEHPWILLKHIGSNSENNYMTIDCRYPMPPHKSNVGIIWDLDANNGAGKKINGSNFGETPEILLGAGRINKKIVKDTTTKTDISVFKKDITFNYFQGIAERDTSKLQTQFNQTPSNNDVKYGQDFNSITVAFVDLSFTNTLPFSGSTKVRPVTYKPTSNLAGGKKIDNKSTFTCWGFDSINNGTTFETGLFADRDYYHFHFDEANGSFIYQLSNTLTGEENFSSLCGFLPISNAHPVDKMPFTSVVLNVDPGFSERTVCFNNPTGKEVVVVSATDIQDLEAKAQTLASNYGKKTVTTFYNTCYRNYNLSDGTSSLRYGNTLSVDAPLTLPCFTPLQPKDSSLFVRAQPQMLVKINPLSRPVYNLAKIKLTTDLAEKAQFSTYDTAITNPGNSGKTNEYKVAFKRKDLYSGSTYPVYTLDGNKKLYLNADYGNSSEFKGKLADATGLANTTYRNYNFGEASKAKYLGGAGAATIFAGLATDIPGRIADIVCLNTTNKTGHCFPSSITASVSSDSLINITPSSVIAGGNLTNYNDYIIQDGNTKYVKVFVGQKTGYLRGGGIMTAAALKLGGTTSAAFKSLVVQFNYDTLTGSQTDFQGILNGNGAEFLADEYKIRDVNLLYEAPTKLVGGNTEYGISGVPTENSFKLFLAPRVAGSSFASRTTKEVSTLIKSASTHLWSDSASAAEFESCLNNISNNGAIAPTRLKAENIPCYIKVPLENIYENGEYLEGSSGLAAYDTTTIDGNAVWKGVQVENEQSDGAAAFSVFKSVGGYGEMPLGALGYTLLEDKDTLIKSASVFGSIVSNSGIKKNDKKILMSEGTKNTSDMTYSELPIFLISLNPENPELKGYVSDLFWAPSGIKNGSIVSNKDKITNPNAPNYSKIYWNGWWLPWLANDIPKWG